MVGGRIVLGALALVAVDQRELVASVTDREVIRRSMRSPIFL